MNNYRKYTNIFFGAGNGLGQVPLSQTWRPFWAAGVAAAQIASGELSPEEAAGNVLEQFSGYSPVEIKSLFTSSPWDALIPTAAQPVYEAFATKENFMGSPLVSRIYNPTDDDNTSKYLRGVRTEQLPIWDDIVNAMVFGEKSLHRKEYADRETGLNTSLKGFDMSPDQLRHLVLGYTGGVGTFVNDLVNIAYSLCPVAKYPQVKFLLYPHSTMSQKQGTIRISITVCETTPSVPR